MPAVHRLGDDGTGHGCFGARPNSGASGNVFVNGIPVHRKSDPWASHCCGPVCHGGSLSAGSGTVKVNGLDIARIGDPVDCGSACASASGNVFAGG
jgi:uncharacterized Zn-binding protein involved in type VI secretion